MVSESDIKDWYNQRHIVRGDDAWRPFKAYPIFLDYLDVVPGKSLLDVGCGTGYLLKAADSRGLRTYGVDISEEGIKIAQKNSPNSELFVGKGENLNFPDGFFDYVICLGAFEHFLDMDEGLREFIRVAKDDARFCIVVPNVDYLFWKLSGSKGTEQQDIHEKLLSLSQWKAIFTNGGLEVSNVFQDKGFSKKVKVFSSLNPLVVVKRFFIKLVWQFLPLRYTYQYVFIMKKAYGVI